MSTKEKMVFDYVVQFKRANDGNSPSIRDICRECEITSTSVVKYYLDRLEQKGKIMRVARSSRGISIIGAKWVFSE